MQRRRENHNFVERRRRDNINHTIATLATLLPSCDESTKLNKGSILQTAVDYVRDLQDTNRA
ncbi:HLH-domain-containing protein, partial [Coemansia reversa NRRL 1564]